MLTNTILAVAALLAPAHWTTVPLGARGELRYQVTPRATSPGYTRTLRLVVVNRRTGRSKCYTTESFGSERLAVQVFRFRGERDYSVLILTPSNRLGIDLLRVRGTRLTLRWSADAFDAELVRRFPGGATIFAQIGNDEYGLIHYGTLNTQAYEVWKPIRGRMCCRRLAVRVGKRGFKLLPRSWGVFHMKATGVWYGPVASLWP